MTYTVINSCVNDNEFLYINFYYYFYIHTTVFQLVFTFFPTNTLYAFLISLMGALI